MRKIAIVTGASSGLGSEFARQLDAAGDIQEIWLLARRRDRLEAVAASLTAARGVVLALDLTSPEAVATLGERLNEAGASVAWLINNAGYGTYGDFDEVDLDTQLRMIDLNCRALTAVTGACLPYLHQGARVVNVGSSSGFLPMPKFSVYAASKAYVFSFSQALAAEFKGRGVSVTCVCPGPVATEFQEVADMPSGLVPKAAIASAEAVVGKALADARRSRPTSIYGAAMEIYSRMSGLLPRDLVGRFGGFVAKRI